MKPDEFVLWLLTWGVLFCAIVMVLAVAATFLSRGLRRDGKKQER